MVAQQADLTGPSRSASEKGILDICGDSKTHALSRNSAGWMRIRPAFAQAVNALLAQQRSVPRDITSPLVVMGKRSGMNRPARPAYAANWR
ncbi:hypothetical protein KCP75_08175 [Salmonella enterica subsp. enterica]|nr:hypothetical protein KCP75_08175 [Salmonella enterica subsp. enterica]